MPARSPTSTTPFARLPASRARSCSEPALRFRSSSRAKPIRRRRHARAGPENRRRRRRAMDRLARGHGSRRRQQRDAKRRPRRYRSRHCRTRARRGARPGRGGQPRQVALPRHGVARDPHAAERHSRHGRSARRHAADARADDLSEGGEDVGRDPAVADRGGARFLQDRSRPARSCGAAVRARGLGRGGGRAAGTARAGQGTGNLLLCRRAPAGARRRRRGAVAPGAVQPRRQRDQVHRTGGVSIIVEPAARPDAIAISVRDTGIGISRRGSGAHLPRIRTGRRRLDATNTAAPVSDWPYPSKIVESMGGSITVESAPGQGSTFRVTVPLPRADDAEEPAFAAPDLAGSNMLIVATAAIEASLIARRLQRWGARTRIVPDDESRRRCCRSRCGARCCVDHALGTPAARRWRGSPPRSRGGS